MINITLLTNKECQFDCPSELQTLGSDFLVIGGEAGVTEFSVTYPAAMADWAKRVEIFNAKGEVEYNEFEGYELPISGQTRFEFSLPASATKYRGYAKIVFKATKGGKVFIWRPEPIPVEGNTESGIPATGNRDLLSAAYETAQAANAKSDSALQQATEAKGASARAESAADNALSKMNALVQDPDCTEANGEGEARVEITADGKLKFINIKGFMPIIQIGNVQAVPPNTKPEVIIREGSGPRNPILDMKLPSGEKGEKGESVSSGLQSIPVFIDDWVPDDQRGYKLSITADKHGLGKTNKIIVDVNPYEGDDGTVISTYDSPRKSADGTITITSRVPWAGIVNCAAGAAEGQDVTARQEIAAHKADAVAHITAAERSAWNAKETPTAAQSKADNALQAAKTYADTKVADLVGSAPELLNTLQELSAAVGNNPNHTTEMLELVGKKADKTAFETHAANNTIHITAAERSEWNSKETTAGAQAKADAALASANAHSDAVAAGKAEKTAYEAHAANNSIHITAAERTAWDATLQAANANTALHVGNKSNPHAVTPAQIGLGNVDNTRDADKSVAAADALNIVYGNEIVIGKNFSGGELYMGYRGATSPIATYRFCDGAAGGALAPIRAAALYEGDTRVYSPNNPPPVVSTAPYVRVVQAADWVADSTHGYKFDITAATHGKGVNAFAHVYNAEGYITDDYRKDFNTGAFTVYSRSNAIIVRVEIRG